MNTNEDVISVRNVTKSYRLFSHPGDRIRQFLSFGTKRYYKSFTALKDVSFNVRKGETVGIIGKNGSGKSTLLQVICGIYKPSLGSVHTKGRISALLELGAGFNPEFTGRENVYFQGALMGLTKREMDEKFEEIYLFSEIGDFIDQPVRIYSTGMFFRLAFAVSVATSPEILIVDEALSVGDEMFQKKSLARSRELIELGASLVVVSHDHNMIDKTCSRCIFLDRGSIVMDGPPREVLDYYNSYPHVSDRSI